MGEQISPAFSPPLSDGRGATRPARLRPGHNLGCRTHERGARGARSAPYLLLPCPHAISVEPIPRLSESVVRVREVHVFGICALRQSLGLHRRTTSVTLCCQLGKCG